MVIIDITLYGWDADDSEQVEEVLAHAHHVSDERTDAHRHCKFTIVKRGDIVHDVDCDETIALIDAQPDDGVIATKTPKQVADEVVKFQAFHEGYRVSLEQVRDLIIDAVTRDREAR